VEEEREQIRQTIIDCKSYANGLFDEILNEFNKLEGVSKKKFHSKNQITRYRRNISNIISRFRVTTNFVLSVMNGFKLGLDLRIYKAQEVMKNFERAKEIVNSKPCNKTWKK